MIRSQSTTFDNTSKRIVVIYFYPKDDTPGCTMEACAFRDEHKAFKKLDAEIIQRLAVELSRMHQGCFDVCQVL